MLNSTVGWILRLSSLATVVDVVFKLLIDNIEFVDKLFKLFKVELPVNAFIIPNNDVDVVFKFVICVVWPFINPNNDVDVVFKLLIDNIEFVDKLFKFELKFDAERLKTEILLLIPPIFK